MILTETAHAKLNLALHVRQRRDDGYHVLETLFVFTDFGDQLTARAADAVSLDIAGPRAAGLDTQDNLVLRAANALRAAAGIAAGAALTLDKRIPVAAGLGGGSADAAATLRLLNRLWQLDWPLDRLAAVGTTLGADVAACVYQKPLRGEGIGDALTPLDAAMLAARPVLLVNPGMAVATAPVFRGWDGVDRGPLATGEPLAAARAGRNDLEASARDIAPVIAETLALLGRQAGVLLARMSGSGATCFALFSLMADCQAAAQAVRAAQPGWWVEATHLAS